MITKTQRYKLPHDRLLRIKDAADLVGYSDSQIREWTDEGVIKSHRNIAGVRGVRIWLSDLQEFLEQEQVA